MAEDLRLSVGLDASDVKKTSKDLEKSVENVFKAASEKSATKGFDEMEKSMDKVIDKTEEVKSVFKDVEGIDLSTQSMKYITQLDKAVSKASELRSKMKELETVQTPQFAELNAQLEESKAKVRELASLRANLQDNGAEEAEISRINNLLQEQFVIQGDLYSMINRMKSEDMAFGPKDSDIAKYEQYKNQLNATNNIITVTMKALQNTGEIGKESAEKTGTAWENVGRLIKQTLRDISSGKLFRELGNAGTEAANKIGSAFTKLPGKLSGLTKSTSLAQSKIGNLGNSVSKLFKKFLLLGFGIRGVVGLFRKLRSGISEGLQAMAVWNGGNNATNRSISMLISSLNYLKASLATAFAPILSVVAPILSAFMDMLARAAQMVGAFFAALTGKSTYTVATKNNTNYAASISKSSAKTKKDTKEQKKNTKAKKDNAKATKDQNDKLADFDDLNVLGAEAQDDLNDALEDQPQVETPEVETPEVPSGGGGGPAIAGFDEKQIPDWVNNLVKLIKDAWKAADFSEIGQLVGERLRDALWKAANWLVDVAQPMAYKIGKSIATFLNGFFETPGLALALGRAIGELINTAIIGINAFLDNTHWTSIGKFLADGLNSAIRFIKWEDLGHMLAQGINALSGMLLGFVQNFDFRGFGDALGRGLTQACKDLDVKQIFASLSGALAGIFEFISGALQGVDWWELGNLIVQWCVDAITGTDWSRLMSSVYEMIGSAFGSLLGFAGGIGEKVWQLLKSAWDYAIKYFSQYTNESGQLTIEGFLQGTLDAIKGIGQWIYDNIFQPFMDGFNNAFDMHSPSKVMEEAGRNLILGLFNGMSELMQKVIDIIIKIKDGIITKWNEFKAKFEQITNTIKTNISKIWTDLKTEIEKIATALKENTQKIIQQLREKVENIVETLKKNFITFFTNLKDAVIPIAETIRDKISGAIQTLHDKTVGPDGWVTKIKTKFIELMNGLKDGIKAPLNTILGFFGKLANGVINAINGMIDALNTLSFDVPDWVPEIGGQKFGLNLNKLSNITVPTLAQGAVIPPNKEFLAMLGDQKQGTNVETPLATMVDAFRIAMQDMPTPSSNQNAIMTLDGQTFARLVVPYVMDELNRRGFNVSVLEG